MKLYETLKIPNDHEIQISYDICREIMKKKAVSFYQAFKHLDTERFKDITAIYAFCRYVDDIADENPHEDVMIKINKLNHAKQIVRNEGPILDNLSRDDNQELKWVSAFHHTLTRHDFIFNAFYDQIEGQIQDVNFENLKTFDDLILYSKYVAGSVGIMLMPLLVENPNKEIEDLCNGLGVAMQITNILRDVGEDIKNRNRVYLPEQLIKKFNLSYEIIRELSTSENPEIPQNFKLLWEHLALYAEGLYDKFDQNILKFKIDVRLPLLLASRNYRAILDVVREENNDCLSKRCYTNPVQRGIVFAKAKAYLSNLESRNYD